MRSILTFAVLTAGLLDGRASQAETQTSSRTIPREVALILSGGVSLGAYEAGYLYLLSEISKASQGTLRIPLLTGASAGSANAFITAINLCREPNDQPSQDLGWQTWMPMDYRSLFDKSAVTAQNVFSREPMVEAFERVRRRWHEGLDASCDIVVGITVTRLNAVSLQVRPGLYIPRQEEKFVLRIRGRGAGVPPRLTNYVDPYSHVVQPLLPFVEDDGDRAKADRNLDLVRNLVFASSAFPLAFGPVELTYCMTRPPAEAHTAPADALKCPESPRKDLFVDGGVFDNNPLHLAHDIASYALVQGDGPAARWRDRRKPITAETWPSVDDLTFLYLDPDTFAYPSMDTDEPPSGRPRGLVRLAAQLSSDFVATARAKELFDVIEVAEDLSDRMRLSIGNYPMASAPIAAFMGFFDREFRRFDYYLGMFDALVQTAAEEPKESPSYRVIARLLESSPEEVTMEWRPLTCLIGYFLPAYRRMQATCHGDHLRDFRVLIQVALDRVYSHCKQLPDTYRDQPVNHPQCARALQGAPPPRVDGLDREKNTDHRRQPDESHLDHVLRLLADYRFRFGDLGLERNQARYGRIKIRRKLLGMVEHIADAQENVGERALLLSAGRSLVNEIAYEPPKDWLYLNGGTAIEFGASFLPFDWNESWARLHAAVQLAGTDTLFTPDPVALRVSIMGGGELEPLFASNHLLQPILGLRAGWQFTNRDTLGTEACTAKRSLDDNRNCTQFALHSYLAIGVLERVRFQLTFEWFPIKQENMRNSLYDLQFGFGIQFF